eukprot:CAMPEP_0194527788 /NCGR_PEP_ID=MMETSP0253-20130528/64010_1 /TAXON_ID=2966 /ORGANISM="Noctiluca scintillans" /LENGTH=152 /DNA_ID=CAMNT_0039372769 /DNA_START=8 /DNA_END=466 /DNA_ORIENTATION=+
MMKSATPFCTSGLDVAQPCSGDVSDFWSSGLQCNVCFGAISLNDDVYMSDGTSFCSSECRACFEEAWLDEDDCIDGETFVTLTGRLLQPAEDESGLSRHSCWTAVWSTYRGGRSLRSDAKENVGCLGQCDKDPSGPFLSSGSLCRKAQRALV